MALEKKPADPARERFGLITCLTILAGSVAGRPNAASMAHPMTRRRFRSSEDPRARVVTLIDGLGRQGGAEHLALEIAARLDRGRFASTLCVSRWPIVYDPQGRGRAELDHLARAGVCFLPLGRHAKLDVWTWARLARYLRRERVDVLHAHKFGSNVWGTLVGVLARVPVIVAHEHTWSYEGERLRRFLDRELIARCAAFNACDFRNFCDAINCPGVTTSIGNFPLTRSYASAMSSTRIPFD